MIDEIVREGARRMLAEALQAEVDAYIARFAEERDERGHRLVVRNGSHEPRDVLTGAGSIPVVAPRVNDRRVDPETGERQRFCSAILPPWARKTPRIEEVLPLLYLHGLSSGDFVPRWASSSAPRRACRRRRSPGSPKPGRPRPAFSARAICRAWIGVRADGRKELVALADGYRESTESWADLLRDARRRGMRAPVLAIGDGALGFWGALGEVFADTRHQRCWFHKISNVLAALPKSAHPGAKKALAEIWNAEYKAHARDAVKAFEAA